MGGALHYTWTYHNLQLCTRHTAALMARTYISLGPHIIEKLRTSMEIPWHIFYTSVVKYLNEEENLGYTVYQTAATQRHISVPQREVTSK